MENIKDTNIKFLKNEFRKKHKILRQALGEKYREYASGLICDKLEKILIDKSNNKNQETTLLVYLNFSDEVSTEKIINFAINNAIKTAAPICVKDNTIEFYYIKSPYDIQIGKFGIPIPKNVEKSNMVDVCSLKNALLIVPGLSFSEKNQRLGYGKGYYDRFLKEFSHINTTNKNNLNEDRIDNKAVGVCFFNNFENELPCEEHDINLDCIITEKINN